MFAMTDLSRYHQFLNTPLDTLLAQQSAIDPESAFFALFKHCAKDVPAYADFLKHHAVVADELTSPEDYSKLPLMTKMGYMRAYSLAQRCMGGSLQAADRIAVSSGSTGQATFWPRSLNYEAEIAVRFEQVLHDSFRAHQRSTLAIVCFALGNWVGGLFTTSCCWHLAAKGYPLMTATPGNNKTEIFRVVRELAADFEQIVLLGYPPFIKDVLDAGLHEGIPWRDYQTKLVFAGEVFSEEWRELLALRTGSQTACFDSASLYGTADGGVLGNETPFTIAIRRWLAQHPDLAHSLFGEARLPTLVQYDPASRYFELENDTLVVSADNSLPLLRYHIADKGGLIDFQQMLDFLRQHGIQDLTQLGLPDDYQPRQQPLVFVFGRADFTVSFYGANIYPENIAVGLEQEAVNQWLSGKFVLETNDDANGDKYLQIAVELLPGIAADSSKAEQIAISVQQQLLRLNSEFKHYTPAERQLPQITLHTFADPDYFPLGVKHRYTRNKH
ncbi:MAG: phenylacetate--CoA ligase family protein [Methylococcaceae bacterium]|nr:phenylacetate--CoA ligase family protein [Methylococcaceae bacterium]